MLREDEIYLHCLEEAEKLIERGYVSDISVEDLTNALIKQLEKSPRWQEILNEEWNGVV